MCFIPKQFTAVANILVGLQNNMMSIPQWFPVYARLDPSGTLSTNENFEAVKKMILANQRIIIKNLLMILAYRSAHAKQFLRMF